MGICPPRHLILGAVALVFGVTILGVNFAREYFALGGETSLTDLPSMHSMLRRTGIAEFVSGGGWTWGWTVPALGEQFRRVGATSVPALPLSMSLPGGLLGLLGVAVSLSIAGLLCLRSTPYRLHWAALALSGFCWALLVSDAVRNHFFFGMFYLGVPLVFFSLAPLRLKACASRVDDPKPPLVHGSRRRRAWAARLATGWVVVALMVFAISGWSVEQDKAEGQDVEMARALAADMHAIRPLVKNKVVSVLGHWFPWNIWEHRLRYFLTGNGTFRGNIEFADFVVAPQLEGIDSLTPENQHVFLYRPAAVDAVRLSYERLAQTSSPIIESTWDAYHIRNALLYVGEGAECTNPNPSPLFLNTYPSNMDNLPSSGRRDGFVKRFFKKDWGWQRDGECYVLASLPTYEIAKIAIGQVGQGPFDSSSRLLWEASYSLPLANGENRS